MQQRSYSRLRDLAVGLIIFPGAFVMMGVGAFIDTSVAWLATGVYFGWLGTYVYHDYQRRHRTPTSD